MCLAILDKVYKTKNKKLVTGWKVVEKNEGAPGYLPIYCTTPEAFKKGVWYRRHRHGDRDDIKMGPHGKKYPMGFHIFESKNDAKRECCYGMERLVQVEGKGLLAVGQNSFGDKGKTWVCEYQRITKVTRHKGVLT